jgi:hypothetical protein
MATRGLPAWPWTREFTDDLPEPERLLLEACRLWAAALREGRSAWLAIRPPLLAEDAAQAIDPLDTLLRQAATLKPMHFGCPLCPRATEDEATLLLACALTQRGARREALALFLRWLPPGRGAHAAMPIAIHLGAALRTAGLMLHNPLRAPPR